MNPEFTILTIQNPVGVVNHTADGAFEYLPYKEKLNWLAYSWFFYDRDIKPMIDDLLNEIAGGY